MPNTMSLLQYFKLPVVQYMIALIALLFTGFMYIIFESTRNTGVVPLGIISFTIFAYIILNQVAYFRKYQDLALPFIVGMIIFMLFLDEKTFPGNPFADFNAALLESDLAYFQVELTTIMSVNFLRGIWLILTIVWLNIAIIFLLSQWDIKSFSPLKILRKPGTEKKSFLPTILSGGFAISSVISFILMIFLGTGYNYNFRWNIYQSNGHTIKNGFVIFPPGSPVGSVTINTECSGIHSFVIFIACFYIALLYIGRMSTPSRLFIAAIIGTLGTLAGNWFRIAIVLLTGYYTNFSTMMFVHDYAGLVVFLSFMLLFWSIALDYLLVRKKESNTAETDKSAI